MVRILNVSSLHFSRIWCTPPTTGVGEDAGKKEPSYTVGGNVD
jgi:hypothetical protein